VPISKVVLLRLLSEVLPVRKIFAKTRIIEALLNIFIKAKFIQPMLNTPSQSLYSRKLLFAFLSEIQGILRLS
jgi:hypothetical protein